MMTNFRPCNKLVAGPDNVTHQIKGRGDIAVDLKSDVGSMLMAVKNAAYVPTFAYNLLSMSQCVRQGYKFETDDPGMLVTKKSTGEQLLMRPDNDLYVSYGRRVDGEVETACAVLTPGRLSTTDVDINHYHRTTAHTHPRLLRESAKQQGVKLKPGVQLLPCVGCSAAKGCSAAVQKSTLVRADKNHGRVFIDTSGKKPVPSISGNQYGFIFRDDASRMSREYFIKKKSDAPDALEQYLADTKEMGVPEIIRSDGAPELMYGRFAEICRHHGIKREFTSANTPQYNGVAERGLTLIEKLAKASIFQAQESFRGMGLPAMGPFWAEAHNFACDNLNRTATTSNKNMLSPYEVWHGKKPPPTLLQWFQPCFHKVKRKHKTDAQAEPGFYLGPALNHPRDTHRILSKATNKISHGMSPGAMFRPLPPCLLSRHFPRSLKAGKKTTRTPLGAGRAKRARKARKTRHFQVVGGMMLRIATAMTTLK